MLNPNEEDVTAAAAAMTHIDAPSHDATICSASQWLPSHLE